MPRTPKEHPNAAQLLGVSEEALEILRYYRGFNARQKQIFLRAFRDSADGKVSFKDPEFGANLMTQLEEARS